MARKVRFILMEQNLLLKLISIFMVLLMIPVAFAGTYTRVIEDFESATGWSCIEDYSLVGATTAHVKEGTNSLEVDTVWDLGGASCAKSGYSQDLDNINGMSIWVYAVTGGRTPNWQVFIGDFECTMNTKSIGSGWNELLWNDEDSDCSPANWDAFDMSELRFGSSTTGGSDTIHVDNFTMKFDTKANGASCSEADECTAGICSGGICGPPDSCTAPGSGDWIIINGDFCTLNVADTITGNLNISDGSLEIQASGVLTISGGVIYIENGASNNNITILSGGQING